MCLAVSGTRALRGLGMRIFGVGFDGDLLLRARPQHAVVLVGGAWRSALCRFGSHHTCRYLDKFS